MSPQHRVADGDIDGRARSENFPVALRVLPRRHREALSRIYDVARHIDDLGDVVQGDRVAQLTSYAVDLRRCAAGSGQLPQDPRLRRLQPFALKLDLPLDQFDALIRANLMDQRVTTYQTFADLLDYCALSAHPIGRLVLAAFEQHGTIREQRSDKVCAALQILEHCQDVAEDHAQGRVYLPVDDLVRRGLSGADLALPEHRGAARAVVLEQVTRCRDLLVAGPELVADLRGWARIAVAGFVAGALATADAIERSHGEVWDAVPSPRRVDVLRHALRLLITERKPA
ncbi:squalene/phytoene synthase family protein [Dermatophilaceae bacterium Sec6.4]